MVVRTVRADVDADLTTIALSGLDATAGMVVQTGADAFTKRTLTGTANEVAVANGTGASGAPTVSLPAALTFTGKTIAGGTFNSPALVTPALGTPASGVLTNTTGYVFANLASKPTTVSGYGIADGVAVVATRAALRALTTGSLATGYTVRTLGDVFTNDSGGGVWRWSTGDQSSFITSDPAGTRYVAPNSATSGASGCWDLLIDPRSRTPDTAAVGDYSNDDRAAVQATGTLVGTTGGVMRLGQSRRYSLTENSTTGYCLSYTNPLSIEGQGYYSALTPAAGVDTNTTALQFVLGSTANYLQRLQHFTIGNPNTGARTGGVGLKIDSTGAGVDAPHWTFDQLLIFGGGNDVAFHFNNDETDNVNGGGYCWSFRNVRFEDGFKATQAGDNWVLINCQADGENVGFDWTGVNGAGGAPSQFLLFGCNTTADGGSTNIHSGNFAQVTNSNTEQIVSGATYLHDFEGDVADLFCPAIRNTFMGAFAGAGLTAHVRVDNCFGAVIEGNYFALGHATTAATSDIVIGSGATDTYVGPSVVARSTGFAITDSGVGTRGVTKTPSLSNSWVDVGSGAEVMQYMKDKDGMVHVWGACKNGTTTAATTIFTLPASFRPVGFMRPAITVNDAGSFVVPGHLLVLSTGEVQIGYVPTAGGAAAQQIFVHFSFRAAKGNALAES